MIYAIITTHKNRNTCTYYIKNMQFPSAKSCFLQGFNYINGETRHQIMCIKYIAIHLLKQLPPNRTRQHYL